MKLAEAMDGVRSFKTTICLVLALLTVDVQGKIGPSVAKSLQKIKTVMTSAGKSVQTRVDKIYKYLDSEKGSSTKEKLSSALETIGGSVSSLTSDDIFKIVSGSLSVISAATSLIPVVGPVISVVFSLIGTIFGAVACAGGGTEDVSTVVRREIENALNKYDDAQLKAEAIGTIRVYKISHAYLASKEGDAPISQHEISALSAHVPIYKGIDFLGKLVGKVKERTTSDDPVRVKQAMEYLQLYVALAVLRTTVLWEMYALVKTASHSNWTAGAIQRVIMAEKAHDINFLKFLLAPEYSQAVFFAYFNPSDWPQTMAFMGNVGLTFQRHDHLAKGAHSLRPEQWKNWYMYMRNDKFGTMAGTTTQCDQSQFYFVPISREDNLFYLKSKKWPTWYVYMKNEANAWCRGWGGYPGPAGEWKVVRFRDGRYMLSPKKWPDWFIIMTNTDAGYIRGWKGDPGIKGHWIID